MCRCRPAPAIRPTDRIAVEIIEPFVRRFRPQLILVSAGFDAHWQDPLTSLGLSTAGFHAHFCQARSARRRVMRWEDLVRVGRRVRSGESSPMGRRRSSQPSRGDRSRIRSTSPSSKNLISRPSSNGSRRGTGSETSLGRRVGPLAAYRDSSARGNHASGPSNFSTSSRISPDFTNAFMALWSG